MINGIHLASHYNTVKTGIDQYNVLIKYITTNYEWNELLIKNFNNSVKRTSKPVNVHMFTYYYITLPK